MNNTLHPRTVVLVAMIVLAGVWRLVVAGFQLPLSNFTPVGAMALFGGCYFASRFKAYVLPILTLLISDIFLMHVIFPQYAEGLLYSGWLWVYAAFALTVLLGHYIKRVTVINVALMAVGAGLLHWIVTNLGVWIGGQDFTTGLPFTKDVAGLVKCFTMAIPFLKGSIIGNLIFSAIMFGAFELSKRQFPVLARPSMA